MSDFKETKDILKVQGVKAKGFGIIPKLVMQDTRLSVEAKAIYSYFCSFAGSGDTAFPSVNKICSDLCLSDDRFRKHFKFLRDYGYIKVEQQKENGKFARNIYTLIDNPILKTPYPDFTGTGNPDTENLGTNNNNLNNNSLNNNQSVSQSVQQEETKTQKETGGQTDISINETTLKGQVGYTALMQQHNPKLVNEIVLNILDMYYSPSGVKVNGNMKPQIIVHSVITKLTHWHIQYVLERFKQVETTIKNKKDYLQSMIYNSVLEMDAHYENEYRSDRATEKGED